jgi:D-amino-acid dehydrogenase
MARTDALVLGAGIVGTSIALHLAKRGLSVALIDRTGAGEGTSFGNAGIIEGNTIFPQAFPSRLDALLRIALKRAPEANYHLAFLPQVAPWLASFHAWSRPQRLVETAQVMRPFFARAVAEHELLIEEAGASAVVRRTGWLKLFRQDRSFAATARERELAASFGIPTRAIDVDEARALEPSLEPVFRHAIFLPEVMSVSNPLALTRAFARRFETLGGITLSGDARTLRREGDRWRVAAEEGIVEALQAVVALGPWSPDLLAPLGIRLPLAVKRGYHRHFQARGNAALARPVLDADNGYCITPMQQGIRLTTGVEFAARDAQPTPVQFARLMPAARELFPLGDPVEATPWMGARPCFADSRPVIGRAPGQPGLWLAYGHSHWGLTLGPATGRLVAELMTGTEPFCDATPFRAERFNTH